ncbi:MAG: hypothetical protein ACLRZ9_12305 [Eubacterium sp.]
MSNKKLYKDTFDKITMSEERFGKVRNMSADENKIKRKINFRFATVLAVLAVVFALSNGIAYAASGSTLVDKAVDIYYAKVKDVYLDGKKQNSGIIDKDGHYKFVYEDGSSSEVDVFYAYIAEIKEIDGKVYMIIGDNVKKIDITDDFKDGVAEVEVEYEGKCYQYTVEGSVEDNDISICKK